MNGRQVDAKHRANVPQSLRALVTGCAGFIGSHVADKLLASGWDVLGVDAFTDFYDRHLKETNLVGLRALPRFRFVQADLTATPLGELLEDVDVIFHLAGQPGVRQSFGRGFDDCLRNNVHATERLLTAVSRRPLRAFVYASSSSVYGTQQAYPVSENAPLRPISPYGLTKVASERLANEAWRRDGVPVVGLRYFTVYGPRQRPDMAFARFIAAALANRPLCVLGDGRQTREFTYVGDVVRATIAAAETGERGSIYNVGGGTPVALLDAIAVMDELVGRPLAVEHGEAAPGDPRRTEADITRAVRDLGYRPETDLATGLAAQIASTRTTATAGVAA